MSNQSQELKITVPSITEIEAPLGGTTLAYNVTVTEGSLSYNVTKTFREFEDLAKKLQKKYQNLALPSLNQINTDPNIRREVADQFMTFISGHSETINGSFMKQFLGIDSEANYQISTEKIISTIESPDEPDSLFEMVTQTPKPAPAPIQNIDKTEKNDLIQEFRESDKIMSQQRGRTSFFDHDDEDDDDDLFKITKPKPQKQEAEKPKKPASSELFESEGIQTKMEINENNPVQEMESKVKNVEPIFDESEIDDSILKLEDNLEDLKHLSLTPKKATPSEATRTKPDPPPKKPSLMKKPALAPKPGSKPIPTKNIEDIDISSYINAEEAASQKEAKLFD